MQTRRYRLQRVRVGGATRSGAILLDLFIATTMLATSLLILSDYGARAIKLAQRNNIERLEMIAAESILAKAVDVPEYWKSRTWIESFQGIPIEIQLDVDSLESEKLRRIAVVVSTINQVPTQRISVSLSRLVFIGEGS